MWTAEWKAGINKDTVGYTSALINICSCSLTAWLNEECCLKHYKEGSDYYDPQQFNTSPRENP